MTVGAYYRTAEPVGTCSCHACTCEGCPLCEDEPGPGPELMSPHGNWDRP